MKRLEQAVLEHVPQILAGLLILLVSLGVALLIRMSLRRLLRKIVSESNMDRLISDVCYYAIMRF